MAAEGVSLNHVARESSDVKRLAKFYQEMFGFEEVETPSFGESKVVWMHLPSSSILIHLIQRSNPTIPSFPVKDPSHIPKGHHLCFYISNFLSFIHTLKEKGIETFETTSKFANIKRAFFFDPDGNGLEVASKEDSLFI